MTGVNLNLGDARTSYFHTRATFCDLIGFLRRDIILHMWLNANMESATGRERDASLRPRLNKKHQEHWQPTVNGNMK